MAGPGKLLKERTAVRKFDDKKQMTELPKSKTIDL